MNIKDFILGYVIGKNDGGGGASVEPLTVTENGEYSEEGVAYSPVTVNVAGGGEIETGEYTPDAHTNRPVISFANEHSSPPVNVLMWDASNEPLVNYSVLIWAYDAISGPLDQSVTIGDNTFYAVTQTKTHSSNGANSTSTLDIAQYNITSPPVTKTGFTTTNATSYYFRAGHKYKWRAIWA